MPRPPVLPVLDWPAIFESGLTYEQWIAQDESPKNCARMEEIRAELSLDPPTEAALGALTRVCHVVAIAEDWCGDVVRHVPALIRIAEAAPNVKVRFIKREQHPDVFARFLTNGGEAVPKFVFLSEEFVECGAWGPMPYTQCREWVARGKAMGDVGAGRKKVSALYQLDHNQRIVISELVHLIDVATTTEI